MKHIFEPFYTTKEKGKGTGLGFPFLTASCSASAAPSRVDSIVSKGTTFTIKIPVNVDHSTGVSRNAQKSCLSTTRSNSPGLAERLNLRNYDAKAVFCAEDAFAMANNNPPDVILLDMNMPGLHGFEVVDELKKFDPTVEIIILSGQGGLSDAKDCRRRLRLPRQTDRHPRAHESHRQGAVGSDRKARHKTEAPMEHDLRIASLTLSAASWPATRTN
ncbi:MAG: response regulator [Desulfomicrobium escambiense]|nr:response regulator [Desulfomicrobium escambiense]